MLIFVIAVAIRGVCTWTGADRLSDDPDAYRVIAQTLATTGVYGIGDEQGSVKPTAFRPPLYPYVLSWMVSQGHLSSIAVGWLHTLLGALTVVFTFLAARQVFPAQTEVRFAGIAAGLVAFDPILLQQSSVVMTETLATMFAAIIVWWWLAYCRGSSTAASTIGLGLLFGLAFLCRPTFLVWAILMTMVLLLPTEVPRGIRLLRAGLCAIVIVAFVAGWTMRNQRALGHPVWATTHGGYTLLLANNPSFYDYLQIGAFGTRWDAEPFLEAYSHRYDGDPNTSEFWKRDWQGSAHTIPIESEVADDRRTYDAARATINRQPMMFGWSCLVRAGRLWSPLPHQSPGRSTTAIYSVGLYYSLFTLLVLFGAWKLFKRRHHSLWWPVITLVITLSVVHAVYWSNLRMRAPAIPVLAIIAAAAFLPKVVGSTADESRG